MSLIYSIISTITRNIENTLRNSFLFTSIFKILGFIENKWINSYFKRLYPSEKFLSFVDKSKILKEELFSPLIVLFTFTLFLLLATDPISKDLQNTIVIAFISFFIGSIIFPRFILNKQNTEDSKNNRDNDNSIPLFNTSENSRDNDNSIPLFNTKDIYSIGFCLSLIGIIFLFISIASVGGLPILKSSLRYSLKPALTMPVFLIIPGIGLIASHYLNQFKNNEISRSQTRFRFLVLTSIGIITVLTLQYRTPIIAILLMMVIIAYYARILSVWEVIIATLLGVGAIIGIGYLRSLNELAISSNTNPFSTLESRANFTMHVLNLLNEISGNFGLLKGKMIASSMPGSPLGPRMLVGKLIAWRTEVTVTPTLLGQMIVDFGKIGVVVEMSLLGFILGTGYKIIKITKDSFYIVLYSLILTYSILGVETGILDIQVLFYFFIASFIYLALILKDKGIRIY
ncbi:oligosaccharide repeat unit polymerase family protein [Methanobrevibacter olleyae]|uniref:Oligosaccharide repeat unit polymerase n=1 Tax=Methanobrevibacter olleyae TaxID=294671 RepID=A0A126QYM4_METOL|nr:oligosaccharide repeat unit polymerase family protein [Methanobrevibacter olleyae]AMK14769.1 oligosaccharide repeat unit polymerase [Methanobrevibacter olleyae]